MDDTIEISKKREFFVAIAKQGIHSFMMLGVVEPDGTNRLLARVGKTNDIDPDSTKALVMIGKTIWSTTQARLADEGISRSENTETEIRYQAYSVNYDQAVDFLNLIREIEEKQKVTDQEEREAIMGFIPVTEKGEQVTFKYGELSQLSSAKTNPKSEFLSKQASEINVVNTCRTTALNMVEAVLGFITKVSQFFFVSPKYKTTLDAGLPNKNSFYILPPPPNTYEHLSSTQQKVLRNLYKKMEEIPSKNPKSLETRAKFDAIKDIYKKISGENKLSANQLLEKIIEHEHKNAKALHAKRDPSFLSRLFGLKSSTEKTFSSIKKKLQHSKEPVTKPADPTIDSAECNKSSKGHTP